MIDEKPDGIERDLDLLSQSIQYPDTPHIAGPVMGQISEETEVKRPAPRWALAGVAAAVVIALFTAILAISSPARDAVADLLDPINIFETDEVPPGTPTEIEGESVTLAEASEALEFEVVVPEGAQPSRVLLQDFGFLKAVALFFDDPDVGEYVLFETNAIVGKGLGPGAEAEPVDGVGEEAYWLTGTRIVQYEDGGGVTEESIRVTDANTLLWGQDGHVFRLEGNLSLDQAVVIARSLR